MPTEATLTAKEFFETYRAAFEALDAAAIADLFAFPLHITSDAGEIALTVAGSREAWTGQVERLLGMYRAIGFASTRVLDLAAAELSPRLFQVIVHWELYDAAGSVLYDFHAMYTLVKIEDALRIAAISHDEIPQYRRSLARLRS